ncbi:MAG: DNA repair protein RadC [Lachnospiraceae bacterium]|nr:DNA repair protein RadC [Lachnospiraceae bacterium]MCR5086290.1 DNA repair protein RadC [Lachnospiraceae bacterium]
MNSVTKKRKQSGALPDDKARMYGFEKLSDAELLAILLRNGTRHSDVVSLAEQILRVLGGSLAGLMTMPQNAISELSGVGTVKQLQLLAAGEISRRIWNAKRPSAIPLTDSASVYECFREDMRFAQTEEVHLALLDVKCRLLRRVVISKGSIRSSQIPPREVFEQALRYQAAAFVLLHNHPSGDPTPSEEDIKITKRILSLGESMQLPMLDHIIIGDPGYFSFKDRGYLNKRE